MKRRRVGIRGSVTPGQILTALPALFSGSHRTRPAAQRRQDRLDLPHETPIEALGLQWDDDAPADEREMSALQWDVLRNATRRTVVCYVHQTHPMLVPAQSSCGLICGESTASLSKLAVAGTVGARGMWTAPANMRCVFVPERVVLRVQRTGCALRLRKSGRLLSVCS
jgi:hypothetical protein